jgi:YjbE family integral membrane protein
MACRALPPRQRSVGIVLGAGAAASLLIVFAVVVSPLLALPYVKAIGGSALIYIAIKLLVPEAPDDKAVAAPTRLWQVIRTIIVADIVMSLDNIVAVAAVARGDVTLLVIGLAVSIPIVLAGAALIAVLLDRVPLLVWAGAALLGWIAGDIIATDLAVARYLTATFDESVAQHVAFAAALAGSAIVIAAGAALRRRQSDQQV